MSTVRQPHLEASWKQEVNRRLAAHKSRKAEPQPGAADSRTQAPAGSRAAEAAARVAARYAKAPTYSQMQAEEARLAVRAAQIATQVALEAQAAAQTALAEMHAASEASARRPAPVAPIARAAVPPGSQPDTQPVVDAALQPDSESVASAAAFSEPAPGQSFAIRWEPDLPASVAARQAEEPRSRGQFELAAEDWWTPAEVEATLRSEPIHVDAQATHANLIEFPRELVAAHKMRPRLAEAPFAAQPEAQLSIFEVHPASVSTAVEALEHSPEAQANAWTPAEWSPLELDAHPEFINPLPAAPAQDDRPLLAPFGRRLMANVVDGGLIFGAFFSVVLVAASKMSTLPALKPAEVAGAALLVLTGLLYHAFFYAMGVSTPGMRYAGIALSTFTHQRPTRAQLRRRLAAMVVSLLPVGIGLVWSVFDEDHLSWHDRASQTFLRKR